MKFDRDLDQSLKNLDKDIKWTKERQQHVRDRLASDIRHNNATHLSNRRSNKILPALSVMFVIAIVTIIIISGIETENITLNDTGNQRTSSSQGDQSTQNTPVDETDPQEPDHIFTIESIIPSEDEDTHGESLDSNNNEENNSQDYILSQAEIMEVIKGEMNSDLDLKLPTEINLPEGKHLTAVTSSQANHYEVIFYQHDEPIPINNKLLYSEDNPAEVVARIEAKKYNSQEEADHAIAYELFDESTGEPIKLREGLTGYQNTDGESVSINWNVGRWALTVHEHAQNAERGQSFAKEIITYLDEYRLPAPRQHGYAHLDANEGTNQITWEIETIVYTIDQIDDPLQALEITVKFE